MPSTPQPLATDLRRVARGPVFVPGDHGFDQACRPWNLAVDQPVDAVVDVTDAVDAAALVAYARSAGLSVTAQPTGHGASGDLDGVILLRTRSLTTVELHPTERTARVGAGVQWGPVLASAGEHGLTGLAGSSPVVGVVGYTLGGGLSWFSRRYGFAANSVRAFDVVDADGDQRRITADTDPDLFWALRGGGGDFALVTSVEFDLHPAPRLYGGRVLWPADRAPDVLDVFRTVTADAPDELTLWFERLQFPDTPPFVAVDVTCLGPADDAADLLRQFEKISGHLSDGRSPLPVAELGSITAEPTEPGAGLSRAHLLHTMDDPTARALVEEPIDPLLSVQLRHLGGALTRPSDSAAGHLDEPYALYLFGVPTTPADAAGIRTRQEQIVASLGPVVSRRKPQTFLSPGNTAADAFPDGTLRRLQDIKRRRDPRDVFRSNYPVLGVGSHQAGALFSSQMS